MNAVTLKRFAIAEYHRLIKTLVDMAIYRVSKA